MHDPDRASSWPLTGKTLVFDKQHKNKSKNYNKNKNKDRNKIKNNNALDLPQWLNNGNGCWLMVNGIIMVMGLIDL